MPKSVPPCSKLITVSFELDGAASNPDEVTAQYRVPGADPVEVLPPDLLPVVGETGVYQFEVDCESSGRYTAKATGTWTNGDFEPTTKSYEESWYIGTTELP